MKNSVKYRLIILLLLSVFIGNTGFYSINAQNPKKNKVRLKLDYVKIMNEVVYFNISASSKIGKKNVAIPNIEIEIYNDEEIGIGTAFTNMKGEARFVVKDYNNIKPDSTNTFTVGVSFYGNDLFKKASKEISFKNADIDAKIITIDSLNYFTATLKDVSKDSLMEGASLSVQVERLFQPLFIGEEFYITDENGTIIVPVEHGIPGIDGNLNIEVVMADNEEYGTVIDKFIAPIGTPIVDESTFDERTMWSPRNKTPLFLLIFPNILIFGMWGIIVYLTLNLFKISKTKKN